MRRACVYCKVNARPVDDILEFKDDLSSIEKIGWECPQCRRRFRPSEIADYVDSHVTYIYEKNYKEAVQTGLTSSKGKRCR